MFFNLTGRLLHPRIHTDLSMPSTNTDLLAEIVSTGWQQCWLYCHHITYLKDDSCLRQFITETCRKRRGMDTVSEIKPTVRETHTEALHFNTAPERRKNHSSSTLLHTLIVPHMQQKVVNVHVGKQLRLVAYTHQIQEKSDCQKNWVKKGNVNYSVYTKTSVYLQGQKYAGSRAYT